VSLPYRVAVVADQLRVELERVLGNDLASLFVYGAALFPMPERWRLDFDFHALVRRPLDAVGRAGIRAVYTSLAAASELGADLDGYFVLLADAARPQPPVHQLDRTVHDEAWALHRAHVHAGRYATIGGLDPREIVPVPTWAELDAALRAELVFVESHPQAVAFGVLNGARILASYSRRDVVLSKYDAAQWAMDALPAEWHLLVAAAVRDYEGASQERDDAVLRAGWAPFVTHVRSNIPA
jgi:hypothetical protein